MIKDVATLDRWPALPLKDWRDTYATLHMWTQMVGKTCLALAPRQNHWWQVAFHVTARGLATGAMPYGARTLDAEFDFVEHELVLRTGEGAVQKIPLRPRSVAAFYRAYLAALDQPRETTCRLYAQPTLRHFSRRWWLWLLVAVLLAVSLAAWWWLR